VHDTGGGDDLVRRIPPEIETDGGIGDFKVDGSDMHLVQHAGNVAVIEVHGHPAKLDELGEFP